MTSKMHPSVSVLRRSFCCFAFAISCACMDSCICSPPKLKRINYFLSISLHNVKRPGPCPYSLLDMRQSDCRQIIIHNVTRILRFKCNLICEIEVDLLSLTQSSSFSLLSFSRLKAHDHYHDPTSTSRPRLRTRPRPPSPAPLRYAYERARPPEQNCQPAV